MKSSPMTTIYFNLRLALFFAMFDIIVLILSLTEAYALLSAASA